MEKNLVLSKNLKLTHIFVNNLEDGKLNTVVLYFTFFGEDGTAYVVIDELDNEYPSYAMTEICSEIADSFNEQLEDEENWNEIILAIKEFIKHWELECSDCR